MEDAKKIGIIGSGLIGRSWTMIFVSAGYHVTLYDIVEEQVTNALNDIQKQLKDLESKHILRGKQNAVAQFSLINGTNDLEKLLRDKIFVQECIPENLEWKRRLYREVDMLLDSKTILSSSTSTFLPTILSDGLEHKSQFVVSHPVNPPYFVPLVEVVPAPWTREEVVQTTFELMERVGQTPIKMKKEAPGFVLNRIQYAIINECFHMVQDGYLDVKDVDKVMTEGLGMRYAFLGPLETAHLNAEGFASYSSRYAESMYAVCQTYKPIPKIAGPTAEKIAQQLNEITPLEKLSERRKWRDECLTKLWQLKQSCQN